MLYDHNDTPAERPRTLFVQNDGTRATQARIERYVMEGWRVVGAMSADRVGDNGEALGMRDYLVLQLTAFETAGTYIN